MYSLQNGIDQGPGAREEAEDLEHEEQAVNLRRQKRDKSKGGSVKSVARSNSGSSKPDNIVQAGSEVDRARDIQHKTVYVLGVCFHTLLPLLRRNMSILRLQKEVTWMAGIVMLEPPPSLLMYCPPSPFGLCQPAQSTCHRGSQAQ
jgi:hypothetical protein